MRKPLLIILLFPLIFTYAMAQSNRFGIATTIQLDLELPGLLINDYLGYDKLNLGINIEDHWTLTDNRVSVTGYLTYTLEQKLLIKFPDLNRFSLRTSLGINFVWDSESNNGNFNFDVELSLHLLFQFTNQLISSLKVDGDFYYVKGIQYFPVFTTLHIDYAANEILRVFEGIRFDVFKQCLSLYLGSKYLYNENLSFSGQLSTGWAVDWISYPNSSCSSDKTMFYSKVSFAFILQVSETRPPLPPSPPSPSSPSPDKSQSNLQEPRY